MNKVIPILPCTDIKMQAEFYRQLGFAVKLYTSPNLYAVMQLETIELHFWGSRKNVPAENSSMCFILVEDVDTVYQAFAGSIKQHTGKIPRSGIPKITKVRDLVNDRRFTLTDPGGNTIYIGTPGAAGFYRTLQNETYAKKFAVLYDIVYSKEDPELAASTLPKYDIDKNLLDDLDKAKYLLVMLEIQQPVDDTELKALLEIHKGQNAEWTRIEDKYRSILGQVD
jgi:hypothetical protein